MIGAGPEGVNFHDPRYGHAALLIEASVHVKVIQSRLGRSSARSALDVCGHLFDRIDEAAADRLDGAVSEPAVRILPGFDEVGDLA